MSTQPPMVTISIQEYDALREIKKAIDSKEVYLKIEYYGVAYVTNDKDIWMTDLLKMLQDYKLEVSSLKSYIQKYEDKHGKLK